MDDEIADVPPENRGTRAANFEQAMHMLLSLDYFCLSLCSTASFFVRQLFRHRNSSFVPLSCLGSNTQHFYRKSNMAAA